MRRRYVQRNGQLVPRDAATARHHLIQGDIAPFVSHVDGSIVGSRADLREHNLRLNVIPVGEQNADIEAKQREREAFYTPGSGHDRQRRLDAVKFALDLESAGRTDSDKQQMIENYRERN